MTKRNLSELLDTTDPGIRVLREWAGEAKVACELLAPSAERGAVLLDLQVTTRSTLGALAYDTGGMLIDGGWIRLLGSGHARLPRTLLSWNAPRARGFRLIGDDAVGGFFALNGGALGADLMAVHYWSPDAIEWESLDLGLTDWVDALLAGHLDRFYEGLRWDGWRADVQTLSANECFSFYPFLWTREGSVHTSRRSVVPVAEAFDAKVDMLTE